MLIKPIKNIVRLMEIANGQLIKMGNEYYITTDSFDHFDNTRECVNVGNGELIREQLDSMVEQIDGFIEIASL